MASRSAAPPPSAASPPSPRSIRPPRRSTPSPAATVTSPSSPCAITFRREAGDRPCPLPRAALREYIPNVALLPARRPRRLARPLPHAPLRRRLRPAAAAPHELPPPPPAPPRAPLRH